MNLYGVEIKEKRVAAQSISLVCYTRAISSPLGVSIEGNSLSG